jgi:hypothetical protein
MACNFKELEIPVLPKDKIGTNKAKREGRQAIQE